MQRRKPRHPKRPQLLGEAGTPTNRIVHTAVYKQTLTRYYDALKLYELYLGELLTERDANLDKVTQNVNILVNHFQTLPNWPNLNLQRTKSPNSLP